MYTVIIIKMNLNYYIHTRDWYFRISPYISFFFFLNKKSKGHEPSFFFYIYLFIYLVALGLSGSMQTLSCGMHVGSSPLTRDWTRAHCIGSMESYPLRHKGSPRVSPYISKTVAVWGRRWYGWIGGLYSSTKPMKSCKTGHPLVHQPQVSLCQVSQFMSLGTLPSLWCSSKQNVSVFGQTYIHVPRLPVFPVQFLNLTCPVVEVIILSSGI